MKNISPNIHIEAGLELIDAIVRALENTSDHLFQVGLEKLSEKISHQAVRLKTARSDIAYGLKEIK